jgi:uncharacterized protein with ACT and thioredoxin-like domain
VDTIPIVGKSLANAVRASGQALGVALVLGGSLMGGA